jgi:hypothetical protein
MGHRSLDRETDPDQARATCSPQARSKVATTVRVLDRCRGPRRSELLSLARIATLPTRASVYATAPGTTLATMTGQQPKCLAGRSPASPAPAARPTPSTLASYLDHTSASPASSQHRRLERGRVCEPNQVVERRTCQATKPAEQSAGTAVEKDSHRPDSIQTSGGRVPLEPKAPAHRSRSRRHTNQ